MNTVINEIIVTANRKPRSNEEGVWLLCYVGEPGKQGTGPHLLEFKPYGSAKEIAIKHMGTLPEYVDVSKYITGGYVVIDKYTLKETDTARHGCVGTWGEWSIYETHNQLQD